jgi:hypothetical protein
MRRSLRSAKNQHQEEANQQQSYDAATNLNNNPIFWSLLPTGVALRPIGLRKAIPYQSESAKQVNNRIHNELMTKAQLRGGRNIKQLAASR